MLWIWDTNFEFGESGQPMYVFNQNASSSVGLICGRPQGEKTQAQDCQTEIKLTVLVQSRVKSKIHFKNTDKSFSSP